MPLVIIRRVAFCETDAAGIIHFTTYFAFMEVAEAELFRCLGLSLLWEEGDTRYGFPRVDCQCRFRRAVHFDEEVTIEMRITEIQESRIQYAFTFSTSDETRCASGSMTTAFTRRARGERLEALPVPDSMRRKLEQFKNQAI